MNVWLDVPWWRCTGMRPEEVFRISWENVRFKPAQNACYGHLFNPFGKTKAARRNIPMTRRVRALLEMRYAEQESPVEEAAAVS